ncbi:hypothetical protein AUC69_12965 [Methyloceanibacter superfactus]|uniref:Formylmethanofuran dehydrogenase subunit C n=1 Tax=Methyloceanibacter superfactus TaxID=1774969 RepID=A0A1E3VUS8_9HYPH|nr:formylmethanofuran dehydrogenase subunit C [Methyloceanibacter superfactus]ODR97031.1 hypothetical protein AUC69_12965 [Methyloceanibacter superfactus]
MSALIFELKDTPGQRLDLSPLVPARLAGMSRKDIEAVSIGTTRETLTVGDAFKVKGKDAQNIHFVGTDERCDKIGAELEGGAIFVDGDAGASLGARMKSGKIGVTGSAGVLAAASMAGGEITIRRNVGAQACGVALGETMGMKGGFVTVGGDTGALLGERMRRGPRGRRRQGGRLCRRPHDCRHARAQRGAGRYAGYGNRRGSLIFMEKPKDILPTFSDCGVMEFDYLRLLEKWLRDQDIRIRLGDRARRLMGDMAVLGKGEMLILA